eukprot:g18264.t1
MRISFYAAAGLATVVGCIKLARASVVTAQQQITLFNPEDFTFSLGGPEPDAPVNGFQFRAVNVNQLPALEGQGISMALVNLDACTINLPHLHPRATEMLYVIGGELRTAFVEENGGEGAVVNDLYQGDVMFFPQGLIHYQQNLGCEPATFLAALNNEDPGAVTITTRFFELPSEAIQASLNFDDPDLAALLKALPEAPAAARRQCLKACGMDDDNNNYEYTKEEDDDDKGDKNTNGGGQLRGNKKFCNSIGCPNGFTPVPDAQGVPCYGNECKVEHCCEAFCSSHACPNNFVPVQGAGFIGCTNSKCTTEQCCDEVKPSGGEGGGKKDVDSSYVFSYDYSG